MPKEPTPPNGEPLPDQSQRQRSLATYLVMLCTLASRLLGFVKIAVINAVFGAQGLADVLNALFSIPNNLRKLMAEGALSSAFIPELNKHLANNNKDAAKKLSRQILAFQYVVLVPLIILAIIFSPYVVRIFVRFPNPHEMLLAGVIFRYFMPYLLLVSIAAIFMAVLNSYNRFLVAALSPIAFSVIMIAVILLTHQYLGPYSMALGVITGGFVQLLMQAIPYKRLGYYLLPNFAFNNPSFRAVLKHWLPVLITGSILAINQQVAFFLASGLESGSASALANAIVFFQLPYGIFSASVNTVYFPQMSREAERGNHEALNDSLLSGLKLLLYLLMPAALIMSLLAREIISVALMRGAFLPANALMAGRVLVGFCVGMFFVAAYNFIVRYYYSKKSFNMPLISAALACGLDIILSLILITTPLRVAGLAYANSAAFFLAFIILTTIARFKYGSLGLAKLTRDFIKVLIACLTAFGVYLALKQLLGVEWWQQSSSLATFGLLAIFGLTMSACILIMYKLLKIKLIEGLRR
ncbi:MAG: murein biosynthesis integral membrane protein MurJ [Spirochaetaceae bacterium]|nr:murein biosynthesis integral membrane protein MurJ [Spirochaetaceae bacterium]